MAVAEHLRRETGTVMIPPSKDLIFGRFGTQSGGLFFAFMLPPSNTQA
jgi:hypothetical protein